jgi:long-chain fatty acid transport protein
MMKSWDTWGNLLRAIALALFVVRAPLALATNGYFASGYGIKAQGVAGVGIAFPQDALTIATNPAGMGEIEDTFDLGIEGFVPQRAASIDQGGTVTRFDGNDTKVFPIPAVGYVRHIDSRWVFGVALFGNGGLNTDYGQNPFARFGAQGAAGVDLAQAFLSPALAYRVTDNQTIAVAANVAYQRFKAKGIGLFSAFSSQPQNVSDRGYDSSAGAGVRLGWTGHFGPYLSLGATWQSKTYMGRFKKYAGLFADQGGFDIPSTYGLGIAVKPFSGWTLALDFQRILYSDIPAVGNGIESLFAGVPLGATHGPGFGWRNISVVKLGTSYDLNEQITVRAGFSVNRQPVPSSQTFFNVLAPGVVENHLALGATWSIDSRNEVSFDYVHGFKKTVNGSGSIPPSFGGGEINVSLEENVAGFGFTHRFAP